MGWSRKGLKPSWSCGSLLQEPGLESSTYSRHKTLGSPASLSPVSGAAPLTSLMLSSTQTSKVAKAHMSQAKVLCRLPLAPNPS
jgi:hypothetical protein